MATLKEVELFAPGHWFPSNGPKKGVEITKDFVAKLLRNTKDFFAKKLINPALKIGHTTEEVAKGSSKGIPLFGSATNFRIKGSKIIADFIGIPDLLLQAIKQKRLTNISIEIQSDAKNNPFIDAIALLGTDSPAVKNLKDLQLFLSEGMPENILCFAVLSWDETESQWRARMRDPNDFQSDTFRTKDLDGVQGIQIITGRLNADKVPENSNPESAILQSYHFSKEFWSQDKAQKWLTARNLSENESFSLNFSEPFMNEDFFKNPIKDEKMGDEKKETVGVDPKDHAEVLAKLSVVQAQLAKLKETNTGLMQFKAEVEDTDSAQAHVELEKAQTKITELETEKMQFSEKESAKDKEITELTTKIAEQDEKEKSIQFSIKKDEVLQPYKASVKDGKLAPAMMKKIEDHLDSQKINFNEETELSIPAKLAHEIGQAYAGQLPVGEQGKDLTDEDEQGVQFSNASEELEHEIFKLQAKNADLDYVKASDLAFKINPTLEMKYHEWMKTEYASN